MNYEKWDARFIELAQLYASWSKDPSRQVGAVIAKDKKQLSQGYNGFPPGVRDTEERLNDRPLKLKLMVHAERNAILNAEGRNLKGATLYTTLYPCCECAKEIVSAGIKTVIYKDKLEGAPGSDYNPEMSALIFREAGVNVQKHGDYL